MNHTPQFEIRRAKEGDFFGRMQCHLLSFAHERGEALMNARFEKKKARMNAKAIKPLAGRRRVLRVLDASST